jgi:hypothetical protein
MTAGAGSGEDYSMRRHTMAGYRLPGLALCVGAIVVLLSGCSIPASDSSGTPTASAPPNSTSPTAEATADPIVLDSTGDAEVNLNYFILVSETLLGSAPDSGGREIIDALVAGGFDKTQMEVTPDTTAVGLDADNIQFSIRMNGDCLVGQSGNVGFHAVAAPLLATGNCLVGNTRAIDW